MAKPHDIQWPRVVWMVRLCPGSTKHARLTDKPAIPDGISYCQRGGSPLRKFTPRFLTRSPPSGFAIRGLGVFLAGSDTMRKRGSQLIEAAVVVYLVKAILDDISSRALLALS
jgi:hypothetical protein